MEILVIDGRSTDSTIDKVNEFKAEPFDIAQGKSSKLKEIQVLDNPKKIVSAGLNIGFRAARGDIIMRMDAHAEYGRDYISQCLAALEKSGAANVGGPALALPGGPGPMAQAIALAHYSPFGLGGGQFRNPGAEGFVETVWPGCFRREVFEKVGYIDERRTRTEDLEFNTRLRAAGYQIFITPLIRAHYY
jgi:GT2 family glycosyltransferase